MRTVFFSLALTLTLVPALAVAGLPKCPNVLIVQDRSGSMSGTNWSAAKTAIDSILTINEQAPVESRIRYGLVLYPGNSSDSCAAGVWFVHPAPGTESAIRTELTNSGTPGCTPAATTFEAIETTPQELGDPDRPNYIIHVTDGQPNCGSGSCSADGSEEGRVETSVKNLHDNQGIITFVVGFTSGVDPDHLNAQAVNGGAPQTGCNPSGGATDPCYYRANTGTELQEALNTIAEIIGGQFSGAVVCDETCYGQGCPDGEICQDAMCLVDPCLSLTCGADEFCRGGACIKACLTPCPPGTICQDGSCTSDPCANVWCRVEDNEVCDNGVCILDPCVARWDGGIEAACRYGQICLPDGTCGDDPCAFITCPGATVCVEGQCVSTSAFTPPVGDGGTIPVGDGGTIPVGDGGTIPIGDGGATGDGGGSSMSTGNSGCGCRSASAAGGVTLALLLLGLAVTRRRRSS